MRNNEEILKRLEQEAKHIEIPESVKPENMRQKLEVHKRSGMRRTEKILVAAVCICVVLGSTALAGQQGWLTKDFYSREAVEEFQNQTIAQEQGGENASGQEKDVGQDGEKVSQQALEQDSGQLSGTLASSEPDVETVAEGLAYPEVTYEEIYASMYAVWEQQGWLTRGTEQNEIFDYMESGAVAVSGAVAETEASVNIQNTQEKLMKDSAYTLTADKAFGTTNVQTVGVEEGDIVKNDGRYLYQSIVVETEEGWERAIQIVDTGEGLKEVSRVGGFEEITEFYIWEDLLVVIENKYMNTNCDTVEAKKGLVISCVDVLYHNNYYHEISFFDLSNRAHPAKLNTFTLQGRYDSSRIMGGYFYGFSRFYASPGEGEKDYDAYVPRVNGVRMETDQILLPEEGIGTSYLVLVSVDLNNPTEFVQTTAILSDGNMYYVSGENIYVTGVKTIEGREGWNSNATSVLRFSYGEGRFALQAEGEIKGRLENSFSLDEYDGHLRAVSTVWEYRVEEVKDDRTGAVIGSTMVDSRQTNALYVLDESLKVVGRVEGLAEDEQIYAARFLGETAYFVTFRQMDPLFAVDLSDPTAPKILSELKISGFSEYLHFYGTDRLLGIGMEADEESGRQEGMKLSMFDISDPANVQEIAKLPLNDYEYSEALYNHRAVLISPQVNIFGFEAEGSNRGEYWKEYLLFSYEGEEFVQKLKLNTKIVDSGYYTSRGTFIGEVFYLLSQNGSVRSYNWQTGEALESLTP